jgi:hypothetical protein
MAKLLPLSSMESTLKYQQVESSNFKQESEAIFELPARNRSNLSTSSKNQKQSFNLQQGPEALPTQAQHTNKLSTRVSGT